MDISYDIHLQVNHGEQFQSNMSSKNFSSNFEIIDLTPQNLPSSSSEMDMEHGDNHSGKSNGYSRSNNHQRDERSDRTNHRQNNGANPNRNNNNSRR